MKAAGRLFAGALVAATLAAGAGAEPVRVAQGEAKWAVAVVHPTAGNKAEGVVWFVQTGDKVRVTADIQGLSPGAHGFHIHEWGDCSSPDGKSAGGHYNPDNHPHAGPDTEARHGGDLGNLEADEHGKAHLEITVDNVTIDGEHAPIIGRSVIIHAGTDDYKTQPTGNAGDRIGCGVIGLAKPRP